MRDQKTVIVPINQIGDKIQIVSWTQKGPLEDTLGALCVGQHVGRKSRCGGWFHLTGNLSNKLVLQCVSCLCKVDIPASVVSARNVGTIPKQVLYDYFQRLASPAT